METAKDYKCARTKTQHIVGVLNLQFIFYSLVDLSDRLGGVMVKASASRAEDFGSIPGRVMPKT